MRRARLTYFQAFVGCSSLITGFALTTGCEPDLDSLSASHGDLDGGTAGKGGSGGSGTGGTMSNGGDGPTPPDTCFDDKRNAEESDVDCGGTSDCRRCDAGGNCTANSDCVSAFCLDNRCREPTCRDEVRNQGETDIDCGGPCVPDKRCDLDEGCEENKDCESGFCDKDDSVCKSHCLSGKIDGDETGVDCGGPTCDECETGQACVDNADCKSDLCLNEACADPSCDDNLLNGDETDKDCGGSCSASTRCALGDNCEIANDCDSYVCDDNECVEDDPFLASDVIDKMEDGNLTIAEEGGRSGSWYPFADNDPEPSTNTIAMELIPTKRGSGSIRAMHTTGTGHSVWGAGVGFELLAGTTNTPKAGAKKPYDASPYRGISFWGRSDTSSSVKVVFPDSFSERTWYDCTPSGTYEYCDKHLIGTVTLSPEWKKYEVLFEDLKNEQTTPREELIETELISIQFRAASVGAPFDYWIDDIIFLPDQP